jgi:hypothetical protein
MHTKSNDNEHRPDRAEPDTDTSSYEQLHGTREHRSAPNRPNAKAPHERDESAHATGNRLDQALPPSDRQIHQAHEDVQRGLKDTDRRGVPNEVPVSERKREN